MGNPQKKVKLRSAIIRMVFGAIMIAAVCILIFGRDRVMMRSHYDFATIAQASFGTGKDIVLVDQGKTAIKLLRDGHRLEKQIKGEREEAFYYAEQVLMDGDTLYVADTVYDTADQNKVRKRLLALTGKEQRTLFEQEYDLSADQESSNEILEFQVYEGKVYFLLSVDYGLELYRIEEEGKAPALLERYYCGDRLNDASIDLASKELAIAVKRGYIRLFDPAEKKWITLETENEHLMPNCVTIRNQCLYFSNLYENKVYLTDLGAQGDITEILQTSGKPVSLEASEDGKELLVGLATGFYLVSGQESEYVRGADYRHFAGTIFLRVVLGLAILCMLWLVIRIYKRSKGLLKNENSIRVIIVVMAVVVVSCFVAYSLMDELFGQEEESLIDNMKLYAELMAKQTDVQAIAQMEGEGFYGTAAYKTLRSPLDEMTRQAYSEGKYYKYTIYEVDETGVRYVLDYDDDMMCGEPYDVSDATYYQKAVESGNSYALSTQDADGTWINLITPLQKENGEIVALLEVRLDMSIRNKQKNNAMWNTVFNVFCTTAVVMMLILEGILLLSFIEKKRGLSWEERSDPTHIIPLRTLIFFTNAADSMQDAFVAILCAELYKGQLPIQDSVAIALPLSAQLLMLALCSSFMGTVGEKHGPARVMGLGLLVQGAGCLCCVLTGNYFGLLIGKMMIGAGMGTVYVNCYAIAAKGKTEESSAKAFTEISAGSLSGVTIGAGLSSVFLSIGGWKMVYTVGAILLAISFLVAVSAKTEKVMTTEAVQAPKEKEEKKAKAGLRDFMLNAPVMGYFLLILLPFMMSLAYREYFLPLVAGENQVSEVNISRFYLLCGLAFLYVGPYVTKFLMKHLGLLKSIFLASSLMATAMLLYVVRPTMGMVFFGMVLLSFVTSFAYGCMYTFFGGLPQSVRYGEAKSMEVYTVFESIGSTAGPLVYGVLLTFGNSQGLLMFGTAMLAFVVFYALIMGGSRKKTSLSAKQDQA